MIDLGLNLGKYAGFVIPAYTISLAGFAWMILDSVARAARWRREVVRLEAQARPPTTAKDDPA